MKLLGNVKAFLSRIEASFSFNSRDKQTLSYPKKVFELHQRISQCKKSMKLVKFLKQHIFCVEVLALLTMKGIPNQVHHERFSGL